MGEKLESASSADPPPLRQAELQYVSIELDGKSFGGWYRLLADGRMELLALANVRYELRPEHTPIEQARGMLADFIRTARSKHKINGSTVEDQQDCTAQTLGNLLYENNTKTRVSEQDWVSLVRSIAAGDQIALLGLYERAHRIVFTLIMRLLEEREAAEEQTLEAFHDIWRQASKYDAADTSVMGWIMNQARSRAIDYLVFERGDRRIFELHGNDPTAKPACPLRTASCSSDVLPASASLWVRLTQRIAAQPGTESRLPATDRWAEPAWEEVAPGISCKLLATDTEKHRVSMLVRLAQGIDYPPHSHAGVEELHLLEGELWINGRKLYPGDYNRAEPGTADKRVWSETGCTCVLMTSTRDIIR